MFVYYMFVTNNLNVFFSFSDENLENCLRNIISETNINMATDGNVVVGMDTR